MATQPASGLLAQPGLKVKAPGGKSMENERKIDAFTLRKLREIRDLSRKEVAVLFGHRSQKR